MSLPHGNEDVDTARSDFIADTLLRSEITSLEDSGRSLMPEGLESGLTLQDMAHLLAFLQQPSTAK